MCCQWAIESKGYGNDLQVSFCKYNFALLKMPWSLSISVAGTQFSRNGCMYGRIFSMLESLKYIFPNWSGYNAIRSSSMVIHGIMKVSTICKFKNTSLYVNCYIPYANRNIFWNNTKHLILPMNGISSTCTLRNLMMAKKISAASLFWLLWTITIFNKFRPTVDQLTHMMVDLIFPSTTSPAITLTLVLQRLLLNPVYMDKCQSQIDEVVGSGRLASLDDRIK